MSPPPGRLALTKTAQRRRRSGQRRPDRFARLLRSGETPLCASRRRWVVLHNATAFDRADHERRFLIELVFVLVLFDLLSRFPRRLGDAFGLTRLLHLTDAPEVGRASCGERGEV